MDKEIKAQIPRPGREAFEGGSISTTEHLTKSPAPVYVLDEAVNPVLKDNKGNIYPCGCDFAENPHMPHPGIMYPKEGGMFVYLKGLKYPTSGFPFPEACQAVNNVKRVLIGQLRFLAANPLGALPFLRRKNLSSWLREFVTVADSILSQFYLQDKRYSRACRQIRRFTESFLKKIHIDDGVAESFAKNFAMMFEFDNAYLFRVQDLANETTKERLLKNPIKEFKFMLDLLGERDPRITMKERFGSAVKLLRLAFFVPGIKKAFKEALKEIDFTKIQMDEADRYHVLRWDKYDFFGQSFKERSQKFLAIHEGVAPKCYIMQS